MRHLASFIAMTSALSFAGCTAEGLGDDAADRDTTRETEPPASGQGPVLPQEQAGSAPASEVTVSDALPVADDPCGPDAKVVTGATRAGGYGVTSQQTSGSVEFVNARMTMVVPKVPSPTRGTLFLWPGLQPLRSDNLMGYGVLQPVLTWGTSCAPGGTSHLSGWWISAQYVGWPPSSTRVTCKGGETMAVNVGDALDIEFSLSGKVWTQKVTNLSNGKSVSFAIDMKGQKQQWLLYDIEVPTSVKPVDDVIFTNVVAKLSNAQPASCVPRSKGTNDWFAPVRASADGKTCCISKVILRASGVQASSANEP